MPSLTDPIVDNWSALSHKKALGTVHVKGRTFSSPDWVGEFNQRRLLAYIILAAYCENTARQFLASNDQEEINNHREYGDPSLIVESTLAALIGKSQSVAVDGAEQFDPDFSPADQTPEDVQFQNEAERALERQRFLDDWATAERLIMKLHEAERDAVKLGDAVYLVSWSAKKDRPRLRTYDPAFYFPVLPDTGEDDFPNRVHLAWEVQEDAKDTKKKVRRITFELLPIQPLKTDDGTLLVGDDGQATWLEGTTFDAVTGEPRRAFPWNDPAKPSPVACYMTDAVWEIDEARATVDDFTQAKASFNFNEEGRAIRQLDLGIDFIPLVHIPNTIAEKDHFGQSSLSKILQILDDLSAADTDHSSAAATSGTPVTAVTGGSLLNGHADFGPGTTLVAANENAKIQMLETASSLAPLSGYVAQLLDRLSVNSRLPDAILGRKAAEFKSGFHMALTFGPLHAMIGQMRLVREEKYALTMKFVQRFFQMAGKIGPGEAEILEANVLFGPYMPADLAAAVDSVTKLLPAKAISRHTAIQMLMEAGMPIEDANEEIERIEREDIESAVQLLEATGNPQVVSDRLGVQAAPAAPQVPEAPTFDKSQEPGQ